MTIIHWDHLSSIKILPAPTKKAGPSPEKVSENPRYLVMARPAKDSQGTVNIQMFGTIRLARMFYFVKTEADSRN
jgi:hypothetical protein